MQYHVVVLLILLLTERKSGHGKQGRKEGREGARKKEREKKGGREEEKGRKGSEEEASKRKERQAGWGPLYLPVLGLHSCVCSEELGLATELCASLSLSPCSRSGNIPITQPDLQTQTL